MKDYTVYEVRKGRVRDTFVTKAHTAMDAVLSFPVSAEYSSAVLVDDKRAYFYNKNTGAMEDTRDYHIFRAKNNESMVGVLVGRIAIYFKIPYDLGEDVYKKCLTLESADYAAKDELLRDIIVYLEEISGSKSGSTETKTYSGYAKFATWVDSEIRYKPAKTSGSTSVESSAEDEWKDGSTNAPSKSETSTFWIKIKNLSGLQDNYSKSYSYEMEVHSGNVYPAQYASKDYVYAENLYWHKDYIEILPAFAKYNGKTHTIHPVGNDWMLDTGKIVKTSQLDFDNVSLKAKNIDPGQGCLIGFTFVDMMKNYVGKFKLAYKDGNAYYVNTFSFAVEWLEPYNIEHTFWVNYKGENKKAKNVQGKVYIDFEQVSPYRMDVHPKFASLDGITLEVEPLGEDVWQTKFGVFSGNILDWKNINVKAKNVPTGTKSVYNFSFVEAMHGHSGKAEFLNGRYFLHGFYYQPDWLEPDNGGKNE